MIVIADSGSTKTDWTLIGDNGQVLGQCSSAGMNPYHLTDEEMGAIVVDVQTSLFSSRILPLESLFFYGSGCTEEQIPRVKALLSKYFVTAKDINIYSDLVGAARALLGRKPGVACILGTGSNSCLYDGKDIIANTPPLGYVLGDEGSGAVLGIRLLNALYKGRLPMEVKEVFERETGLTMAEVVRRVYREPQANRFLSSLSLFVGRHLDMPSLRELVVENFRDFLCKNVKPYMNIMPGNVESTASDGLCVCFVGSMACHYEDQLREAARLESLTLGTVVKSPMEGLIRYHLC